MSPELDIYMHYIFNQDMVFVHGGNFIKETACQNTEVFKPCTLRVPDMAQRKRVALSIFSNMMDTHISKQIWSVIQCFWHLDSLFDYTYNGNVNIFLIPHAVSKHRKRELSHLNLVSANDVAVLLSQSKPILNMKGGGKLYYFAKCIKIKISVLQSFIFRIQMGYQ